MITMVMLMVRVRWLTKKMTLISAEIEKVKKDQAEALSGSYGMGQRMIKLEKRLKVFVDAPPPEPIDDTPFSYSQAAQMIAQGADVEAIAATCGLSHSEAHLMRKLCAEGFVES
ncbi:MAG: DUF2802 domain-containing protein [Marinagarivorans sp.]|nr:DUF2802 domain-containing protein [Marinagarivorans sp.]